MKLEIRALYFSLRMLWLEDPTIEVETWQVENYRQMSLPLLFSRLRQHGVNLDKARFQAAVEDVDTPEELTEELGDAEPVYLLILELWRRLEKERPSLSIFCDELDHQIHYYHQGRHGHEEELQDLLANLKVIVDENVDAGGDPIEVMEMINAGCAQDIDSFLYEFIGDQVDNLSYASELIDSFEDYIFDGRWFDLLRIQVASATGPAVAARMLDDLVDEALEDSDLDFSLELLGYMVQGGNHQQFVQLVRKTLELIELESDFQELITICADYYGCLDMCDEEAQLQQLLNHRPDSTAFDSDDDAVATLNAIVR